MKTTQWWCSIAGAASVALALSACGSSDSSGDVTLRLANATLTHPSLDLLVGGSVVLSGTAADTVSGTTSTGTGTIALQVNDAGGGTSLVTSQPTLSSGLHYVVVAYESGGAVRTALINEDFTVGATGATNLRIVDLAPEAGKLDVYITANATPATTASTQNACAAANLPSSATGSFLTTTTTAAFSQSQGNGSFAICVTGNGNKTDLRLAMPITLVGAQAVSVLLTPASGGALLNGSVAVQQSTYSATRNTYARVRLAAAVSNAAVVAASSSSGAVIDTGNAAPNYGFYTLVPAADSLNVTVNGASVGLSSGALKAGADSTLVVYGTPATATAKLVADDNRPPTDATTAKVRLINGVTGSTGTLTLTAGSLPIGINIGPGAVSPYATITPSVSTTTSLQLSSSTNGAYPADLGNTLTANTVYSVLAVGDVAAPRLLVR